MFWGKKNKQKKADSAKKGAEAESQKPMTREQILAQAKASAAAAREEIGDETLEKIREAMARKENNPFELAKRKVMEMDRDKVADSVSSMMREKD